MQTTVSSELLISELYDALPDSVIWFRPVVSAGAEVTDFYVGYCNNAAARFLKTSKEVLTGATIFRNDLVDEAYKKLLFAQCLQVWQSGRQHEERFYNAYLGRYFSALRSKVRDGVMSVTRDHTDAYLAEQEKITQHDLMSGILDASINAIFACASIRDETGTITDLRMLKINKAFTDMIGLTDEQVVGKTYLSLFPSAVQSGTFALNCEVIETGKPIRKEMYYTGEGLDAWYDISLTKMGKDGLVVTFTNITESRHNKQVLQKNSEQLSTIINTSQSGVVTCTPVYEQDVLVDFRFTMANKALARFARVEPEALVGEKGSDWFTRYKSNGLFEKFKDSFENGNMHRFDFFYQGTNFDAWVDILSTRMGDELLITFTDFTEIKKLQEANAISAERLNTIINSSQVGIFTLLPVRDESGRITDMRFVLVNPSVAAYIGQKAEDLVGGLGSKWFPAYKENGLFDIYVDVYSTHQTKRFDFHYDDGYDVYFNIMVARMGDELLVTFTDQTNLKKLQLQLEASVEELKKSNANLEEFAYVASHDLQEPLRKVQFFLDRLKSLLAPADEVQKVFGRLEAAGERMRTLIHDLLTYSQVGMKKEAFTSIDLNQLVHQVVSDMEATVTEKNAAVTVNSLPVINGDESQLRQMFQNLISNALKYQQPGVPPRVTISSKKISGAEASFPIATEHAKDPFHEISIRDNGIGFEQEHGEKIFQVFQRLHGKAEYPGTGVGLSIVKKVVDNHHGQIRAESALGEGAIFTILLPAQP